MWLQLQKLFNIELFSTRMGRSHYFWQNSSIMSGGRSIHIFYYFKVTVPIQ